jgi:hypothetical protein
MDGVLTDFVESVEYFYECRFNKRMPGNVCEEMESRLKSDEERDWFYELVVSDKFHGCMDWCPGGMDLVEALYAHKRFLVVTAPMPTGGTKVAAEWMAARMRSAWVSPLLKHLVFASNETKPLIPGDMLIEDRVSNLVAWKRYNPKGRAILVFRPWSGCTINDIPDGVEMVSNSYHASLIVKDFSNG